MPINEVPAEPLISAIPEPQQVRERLGKLVRQAQLLRRLLKVSEQAAKEKGRIHRGDVGEGVPA